MPVRGRIHRTYVGGTYEFTWQWGHTVLVVALMLAGLPARAAAAPLDPSRIDTQAAWLVHLDLDAVRGSQTVARWTKPWLQSPAVRGRIEKLERLIGFNPTNDLHSVTLYGKRLVPDRGVMIVQGDVDHGPLQAFLESRPDYTTLQHDGRTVMSWTNRQGDRRHTVYAMAHGPKMMLFSRDVDDLIDALDVLEGKRQSMAAAASPLGEMQPGTMLTIRVRELGESPVAWKSPILRLSDTLSFAMGEHEGRAFMRATLKARSEENIDAFRDVAEGLLALGRLLRADDPDVLRLLNSVETETDGSAVEMRWSGHMDDLAKVIVKEQLRKTKSRAAAMRKDKN